MERIAECHCGQLRAITSGEPGSVYTFLSNFLIRHFAIPALATEGCRAVGLLIAYGPWHKVMIR